MDKPEDIPSDVWDHVLFAVMPRDLIGSTIGNMVLQNTCRAILSAQSQAYIDAARIADQYADAIAIAGEDGNFMSIAPTISAAILSRKDEVGR